MADASLFAMTAGQEAPLFNQSEFSLQSGMCKYKCLLLDCFVYSVALDTRHVVTVLKTLRQLSYELVEIAMLIHRLVLLNVHTVLLLLNTFETNAATHALATLQCAAT